MKGYLVTFYTEQNRRHQGHPLHEWLLTLAKNLNLRGATVIAAIQGVDHHGHFHSAHFFDLAEQPIQIQFALTRDEVDRLFSRLDHEEIALFYVKSEVEFGTIGTIPEENAS